MARRRGREMRTQRNDAPTARDVAPGGLEGGQYRPLGQAQVERILDAAYEVLERTGIEVHESPCREVFAKAGCRIEPERNRVYIPAKLIDEARQTAAREVLLAGRGSETHDLRLGGKRVYLGTGGQAVKILDLDGKVRPTRLSDNFHIGRLVDTLDHVHFYMRPVVARDLANEEIDVNQFYACLAATPKHVMANAYLPESLPELRRMGDILAGGKEAFDARPVMSFTACWTVSPLRYATETVEILDAIIDHDMPVVISSAPQAGATSPASLAGTLVQIMAEQLSGIVYVNLRKPGYPVILGCVPAQADLRSGAFTGGSAEFALLNAACAQIAQHLDIPIYNSSGISDSKVPDAQAGFEKGLTTTAAALSGANYIHHSAGFLESLLTVAYEQFVIDNDLNGAVMRMVKGIEVSEESLAIEVIDDVCRGVGHYLGHAHTLGIMNSEYLYPEILDRRSRDDWQEAGGLDLRAVAVEKAKQVLAGHWPQVIPAEQERELRKHFNILLPEEEMRAPFAGQSAA